MTQPDINLLEAGPEDADTARFYSTALAPTVGISAPSRSYSRPAKRAGALFSRTRRNGPYAPPAA